jgi:hypothetical protein
MAFTSTDLGAGRLKLVIDDASWSEILDGTSAEKTIRFQLQSNSQLQIARGATAPSGVERYFFVSDYEIYEDTLPLGEKLWMRVASDADDAIVLFESRDA